MKNNKLSGLLYQKMSRKDFLKIIGIGALSVVGLSTALKNFDVNPKRSLPAKKSGYGASAYGR